MPANFAIVVSAHRMYPTLPACVAGFRAIARKPEDVVFVDNGSASHIGKELLLGCPGVTTLRLTQNRFFCGGYNEGIRYALDKGYDFILIANADTEIVNRDFIEGLLLAAARRPKAAFLGPLVYLGVPGNIQRTCLRYPDIWRQTGAWPATRLCPKWYGKQPDVETEVEFLNGVCVLCRVSALREIGLMDESFAGYVEDADWAWRAKSAGWSSVFVPCPSIVHHEEAKGYEHYSLKTFLLKRNTVLWLLKAHRHRAAAVYAWSSLRLGRLRALLASDPKERDLHYAFLSRLTSTYAGLLRGDDLGSWFGPPLGPFEE